MTLVGHIPFRPGGGCRYYFVVPGLNGRTKFTDFYSVLGDMFGYQKSVTYCSLYPILTRRSLPFVHSPRDTNEVE